MTPVVHLIYCVTCVPFAQLLALCIICPQGFICMCVHVYKRNGVQVAFCKFCNAFSSYPAYVAVVILTFAKLLTRKQMWGSCWRTGFKYSFPENELLQNQLCTQRIIIINSDLNTSGVFKQSMHGNNLSADFYVIKKVKICKYVLIRAKICIYIYI